MLALGFLALAAAVALAVPGNETTEVGFRPAGMAWLTVLTVTIVATMHWFMRSEDYRGLDAPVEAIAAKPRRLSITPDIAIGHPLVRELHGQWVGSVCSQWISGGALILEGRGGLGDAQRTRLDGLMALDRRLLTADIRRSRPDVILVEKEGLDIGRESFDWIAWARVDPALAAALADYEPVKTIQGVVIWARKDRLRG